MDQRDKLGWLLTEQANVAVLRKALHDLIHDDSGRISNDEHARALAISATLQRATDSAEKIVVFGGTFDPPHNGHIASVDALRAIGHRVVVVTSAGHEGKPGSAATYQWRKHLAGLAFGDCHDPIEDHIDVSDPRRALLVLRRVRQQNPHAEILFAVGPDIDPRAWTGYEQIIGDGFDFLVVPEYGTGLHSTNVREHVATGNFDALTGMVPPAVVEAMAALHDQPFAHVPSFSVIEPAQRRAGWTDHGIEWP
jgi:cytidyltransferase-like protein